MHSRIAALLTIAFAIAPVLAQGQTPAGREIDQALAWIQDAKRNYTAVRDYTGTLVTRERIKGKLSDENIIELKFKVPFSIYMRWISPQASRGTEVAFVYGKNNNKMRVHSNKVGEGKLFGFVSIDVNDPRVLETSRHTIIEAGIGNLIERTHKAWMLDKSLGKTDTRISEIQFNNRACYRIENIRRERHPQFYAYRSVLFLDKESKLPIRNENYDWPAQGGSPEGELMEVFSYLNLQFNVNLPDRDFEK
jgi:hypothetical protein